MFEDRFASQRIRNRPYLQSEPPMNTDQYENADLENLRAQTFTYIQENCAEKDCLPVVKRIMQKQQESVADINDWVRKGRVNPHSESIQQKYYEVLFYLTSCIPLKVSRLTLYRGMHIQHLKGDDFGSFLERITDGWKNGTRNFLDKQPIMHPNSFWSFSADSKTAWKYMFQDDLDGPRSSLRIMIVIPNIMNWMYGMAGDTGSDEIVLGPEAELHIYRLDYEPPQLFIYVYLVQPVKKCNIQLLCRGLDRLKTNVEYPFQYEDEEDSSLLPMIRGYKSLYF